MSVINNLFSLPTAIKRLILVVWDAAGLSLAFALAYWIRLGLTPNPIGNAEFLLLLGNLVFTIGVLMLLSHYRQVLRYLALKSAFAIVGGLVASIVYLLVMSSIFNAFLPMSVPIIYFTFGMIFVGGPRLVIYMASQSQGYYEREKCLVYGAEHAGRALVHALNNGKDLKPIAFIDDKSRYQGKTILGLPVVAKSAITKLIKKHQVKKILLAVNNTSQERRKEILVALEPYALELMTVPDVSEVASGKRKIDELKEVKIEELLGRSPVPPIAELLKENITGKHVLVTGAGGSIGSELCRQIAKVKPDSLTLFELSEYNLYQIEHELRNAHPKLTINAVLASIQDNEAVRNTIEKYEIKTIYHAAAYKHVPMVEKNVPAGIRNNVFGTANVALIAAEYQVEKFVLVSTDKAVRPTNIMGATKRFAELFVQGLAELGSTTEYAIVRFGNVLGSSGSVVPVFEKQIKANGPMTVTHPDIIRYFMTIPEAAQLVIQAGSMGQDGEVFVLDMGDPVRIADLAKKMAHLMGRKVRENGEGVGDIDLVYTGLRPGEKLYEELLIDDAETETKHPRIMGANEIKIEFAEVVMLLDRLNYALIQRDEDSAYEILLEAPLAYTPAAHSAKTLKKPSMTPIQGQLTA